MKSLFNSPKELQNKIDEYFETNDKPTISGLSLFLGFADRHSFYDYEKRQEYSHTIKKARARMVKYYEENIFDHPPGSIFMLKNFGYSDKQALDITSAGKELNTLTDEELTRSIRKIVEAISEEEAE